MRWHGPTFWREIDRGITRYVRSRIVHACLFGYFLCDMLPKLPDPLAKKIVDKVLSALGLGD